MNLDFSKICRVCLGEGTMMSLFKVNISKKLMACSSIQVWQNDGLPGQICNKCSAKLHISFQFKKQCEKSDAKLRHYLACLPTDEEKVNIQDIKRANNEIVEENPSQQIGTQTQCVYVQGAQVMETVGSEHTKYDHFMTLPQNDQAITQLNYGMPTDGHMQASSYNIQGQLVYNPPYTVPIQPLQQTSEMHGHIIQPEIQSQVQVLSNIPNQTENDSNSKKFEKADIKGDKIVEVEKQCPTCNKIFGNRTKLSRHMKIHSAIVGDLPHKCKFCNKGFSHSGNFKIHIRMHTDERPFKCPVCNRGCRQAQDLEKHMRTHTGERPHKCHLCPRAFSTSSNLIAHIRTHTGERPYVCCVCQRAFCQSNELTKHMRTHTGEKSHVCEICNKGFNGSSTLIVHRRSHTGERPYVCTFCKKGFAQSSCLTVHLRKHKQNILNCTSCDAKFIAFSDLKSHLTSQHNVEDTTMYDGFEENPGNLVKELACNVCEQKFSKANEYKKHLKTHSESQES